MWNASPCLSVSVFSPFASQATIHPPTAPSLPRSRSQEIAKLQGRVAVLESGLVECKAGIADNKQWVERLKPCLEWKARIEALEAAAAAVRCTCGVEKSRVPLTGTPGDWRVYGGGGMLRMFVGQRTIPCSKHAIMIQAPCPSQSSTSCISSMSTWKPL